MIDYECPEAKTAWEVTLDSDSKAKFCINHHLQLKTFVVRLPDRK